MTMNNIKKSITKLYGCGLCTAFTFQLQPYWFTLFFDFMFPFNRAKNNSIIYSSGNTLSIQVIF